MSRILVTGGSGFIGTNLVQEHRSNGDEVLNLDIRPPRCGAHAPNWVRSDIRDKAALGRAFEQFRPEYVYHMAARADLDGRSLDDYDSNTLGVSNVLEVATKAAGIRRVVYASTMLVCRLGYMPKHDSDYCPDTAYGESKVEGERRVRAAANGRADWIIARPTSIWGPWFDAPYKNFFATVRRRLYVHPRGVEVRRSYGFVGNVVFELKKLLLAPAASVHEKTFYVGDYRPTDVRDWANTVRSAFGLAGTVPEVPLVALRYLSRLGDLLHGAGLKRPPLTSRRLHNLVTNAVFDFGPLQEICGSLPYNLDEGVQLTVDWMLSHA